MEVGLHQASPPSLYTICEHCGTDSFLFQRLGLPGANLAFASSLPREPVRMPPLHRTRRPHLPAAAFRSVLIIP